MCIIKRFSKNFNNTYILIARLNYDQDAAPKDINIYLPGWFHEVKKLYYFEKEFTILDEDIPRIKAKIVEQNQLGRFGSVSHRFVKKRGLSV